MYTWILSDLPVILHAGSKRLSRGISKRGSNGRISREILGMIEERKGDIGQGE